MALSCGKSLDMTLILLTCGRGAIYNGENADEVERGSLMWKRFIKRSQGQSLVELALTLPILLIVLLGLVEVGFALRAYLVVTNVSREAARFASRGTYMPQDIFAQARSAFGGQLPVRFVGESDPNSEVIITYFFIPAVDDPNKPPGNCGTCASYTITTTGSLTMPSKLDVQAQFQELRVQNAAYNEELGKSAKNSVPVDHNAAVIEIYYYHKQVLVDAPIISWIFPDTMPIYARTMMRIGQRRLY
jgi:hypothetical protein